jgi:SMC interacting uncharacterized protein involved in chromosome segregation
LNEASQKEISLSWAKEREELKKQMNDMRSKAEELESAINAKEKKIKELVRFPFNLLTYSTPLTQSYPKLVYQTGSKCEGRGKESS